MNVKGEVALIQDGKVKVYIKSSGLLTNLLDVATHIEALIINDQVVVAFYNNTFDEGAIIAKV